MTKETKIALGILSTIGGLGYIGYLQSKLNKLSAMIDVAVDDLATKTEVSISDDMLRAAIQRAVDREARYISNKVSIDLNSEIRSQVKSSVSMHASDIKASVATEITKQVKNIDISDIEREVVNKAKDAVAEKFDRKLDGLLDDFNANLNNVQKIYSSIAKSIVKE